MGLKEQIRRILIEETKLSTTNDKIKNLIDKFGINPMIDSFGVDVVLKNLTKVQKIEYINKVVKYWVGISYEVNVFLTTPIEISIDKNHVYQTQQLEVGNVVIDVYENHELGRLVDIKYVPYIKLPENIIDNIFTFCVDYIKKIKN